ncbi:hypothetical protein GCM10009547_42710 [Sporichthya brevicatena]|uniref:DUF4233 domain-containing protein n=1 Tax=Sporichthya brevicatena TaxID=171442 RepID=A0ABP3SDD0_9ACTN
MSGEYEPRGLTEASRIKMTRRLCSVVLIFEGLVVFFGALVASRMSDDVSSGAALAVGGGLALGCVLATGLLRSPAGIPVGWAVQVLVLLTAVIVPAMVILGLIFGGLWIAALRIGRMVAEGYPGGGG